LIDYGAAPAPDEVEVSVFGPGFGESIAVHMGEGAWLLVDSCLEAGTGKPATQNYLHAINVPQSGVKAILASHWHDDHVRGISGLARAYPEAEFHLSDTFNREEALALLAAHSGRVVNSSRGTRELYTVIQERSNVFYVKKRSIIFESALGQPFARVTALSPVPLAFQQFVSDLAQFLPAAGGGNPINNVVPLKPNLEAVAVHIDLGHDAILLGSDLENHSRFGWQAVVADSWVAGRKKASALKVAHHGSATGDHPGVWATLLDEGPIAALTPYNRGSKLPTSQDVLRLKTQAAKAFISSDASRKPQLPAGQLKRLQDMAKNILPVNNGFGCVRMRRRTGEFAWRIECLGNAKQL